MLESSSIFSQSRSFNSYSSKNFAEIASKVCEEFINEREELGLEVPVVLTDGQKFNDLIQEEEEEEEEEERREDVINNQENEKEEEDDFEFTFICRDQEESPISADEIFANGQIRPIFPIFNRDLVFPGEQDDNLKTISSIRVQMNDLFIGERDSTNLPSSSSSSEADEVENLPEGTYCIWTTKTTPISPESCKKSNSTGSSSSSSRRCRFRDFVFRSNSDGKDTFLFLNPSTSNKMKKTDHQKLDKVIINPRVSSEEKKHSGESRVTGSGHEMKNRASKGSNRRKTYLPYRQDLVGFFSNVNGFSRNIR